MGTPIFMHPKTIKYLKELGLELPGNVVSAQSLPVRPVPRVTSEKVAQVLRTLRGVS